MSASSEILTTGWDDLMRNGVAFHSVRTLFFSDVHLGSRYCNPRLLRDLIDKLEPEQIYIVGDFCDGWLLRRRWRWCRENAELVASLHRKHAAGADVFYILGNHDRCLQRWIADWGDFWIGEKCIHRCADGRDLLVIHGDQFDGTQTRLRRAAGMTAVLHERMLGGGRIANRMLAELGISRRRLATALTVPFKSLAHSVSHFRLRARQLAAQHGCVGILSGHTHSPLIREEKDGFLFLNTGDWLEHCTAVVESHSGQLELWMGSPPNWLESASRIALSPAKLAHQPDLFGLKIQ